MGVLTLIFLILICLGGLRRLSWRLSTHPTTKQPRHPGIVIRHPSMAGFSGSETVLLISIHDLRKSPPEITKKLRWQFALLYR